MSFEYMPDIEFNIPDYLADVAYRYDYLYDVGSFDYPEDAFWSALNEVIDYLGLPYQEAFNMLYPYWRDVIG